MEILYAHDAVQLRHPENKDVDNIAMQWFIQLGLASLTEADTCQILWLDVTAGPCLRLQKEDEYRTTCTLKIKLLSNACPYQYQITWACMRNSDVAVFRVTLGEYTP